MKAQTANTNRKSAGSQQMFSKPVKSSKNSILSQTSSRTPVSIGKASKPQTQEDFKTEEVITEVVDEIIPPSRDDPIMKSGTASSRNHHRSSITLDEQYSNTSVRCSDAAAPNSPPSRQSKVSNTQHTSSSMATATVSSRQVTKTSKLSTQEQSSQKLLKQNPQTKHAAQTSARLNSKVGSITFQQNQTSLTKNLGKDSSAKANPQISSTLDPANTLAHTTATRAKKQPTKERTTSKMNKSQSINFSQAIANSSLPKNLISQGKTTSMAVAMSQKNFKMYSTMQQSASSTCKSQHGGGFHTSPRSSVNHRRGGNSPTLGSRSSATKDYDHAILHSQAMIQRSKDQRLNSGGREVQSDDNDLFVPQPATDSVQLPMRPMVGQSSPLASQPKLSNFQDSMRNEVVLQLRSQLDDERRKHREMKQMFEDTMLNMEQQNRGLDKKDISQSTSKAVDEILNRGVFSQSALTEELEKQKRLVAEMKQNEVDLQNQNQHQDKQLMHAQMRFKEAVAKEQIRVLQQETSERRLRMEVEKLREQVKDLRSNEEQIKSDHAQHVIELTDTIESERQKQASECEENYLIQINEIKQAHARERENLVQQKFAATQELQMIKMDHSELIRNTNFEERSELMETISQLQAQIGNLQVVLTEQQSSFDLHLSQVENEKKALEIKANQLENYLETEKSSKEQIELEMTVKNKILEAKLEKVTLEKDKLYKNQMNKIQDNLEQLKEQIASTNQSLIDQSYMMPHAEQSTLATGVIARLHSPDFHSSRHRRGDALGASSPRVPRRFAHLNVDNQASTAQRMQSPLAALASHRQRDKSGDQRGLLSGSEMQELTQMMSSGMHEQTINLGQQTAGQTLFNQTSGGNNQNAVLAQNSFLLEPMFSDYYIEYVMLHKLQALTNNFTCQKCWQVLNFQRFFDEDHECLKKIDVQQIGEPQHQVRHSKIGSDSIEEFKEARGMFSNGAKEGSRVLNEELQSFDGTPVINDQSKQDYLALGKQRASSSSAYQKRGSYRNLGSMMKTTAQAAATGASVVVTEINLAAASRNNRHGDADLQKMTTGSFQQQNGNPNLEISMDGSATAAESQNIYRRPNNMISQRQQVNVMQLDVYIQKIKEYQSKIEELELQLEQCKQENDSLIDDLRDTKTKVAVLEESKAHLQMEVTKLRKSQIKKITDQKTGVPAGQKSPHTPQTLNLTVNANYNGVFGLGGKSNLSVKVQPALTKSTQPREKGDSSRLESSKIVTASDQLGTDPIETPRQNHTPSRHRKNQSDERNQSRQMDRQDKAIFRSPQSRMIPLSQKFSAFPTSELKLRGRGGTNAPSTIYGGQTRNYGHEISMQSSQAALQSCSFNNLTQQLNGSMQHLRQGGMTARESNRERSDHQLQNNLLQVVRSDQIHELHKEPSSGAESCDISPDNDFSRHRQQAQNGRSYLAEVDNQMVEDMDGDISSMNPLVTPGLADVTENRVSLFEANNSGTRGQYQRGNERSPDKIAAAQANLSQSNTMMKMNNPYDEVGISQQQKRMMDDSHSYSPRDISPRATHLGTETRQTIFPGMTKSKRQIQVDRSHEKVQVKKAVPIQRRSLDMSPKLMPNVNSERYSPATKFQGTFSALEAVHKRQMNPHDDEPLGLEDLQK